jgi:predicted phage baseplate assembly protein
MNTVPAEQAVPVGDMTLTAPGARGIETERVGEGTGRPNQQLTTSQMPIQASSFHLFTIEAGEWREWTRRPDFDASGRADNHYVLDAMTGVVTFGDGNRGRASPYAASIVVSYRTTRAESGDLAAGAIDRISPSGHNMRLLPDLDEVIRQLRRVTNPVAAMGGAAAESVAEAQGRVLDELECPQRAVTLEDYEELAKRTPGIRLARVAARALLHPSFPCLRAPGMITVIVLPYLPVGRPMPGCELLRIVAAHLNGLRSIGTRVEVIGPVYVEVTARSTVESCAGPAPAALRAQIVERLNQFLDPLVGGPDGTGWPFGRDVYRSEILQVIDQTPGVDHVVSLDLIADGGTPQCGNICIGALGLVTAGQHRIEVVQRRDVS